VSGQLVGTAGIGIALAAVLALAGCADTARSGGANSSSGAAACSSTGGGVDRLSVRGTTYTEGVPNSPSQAATTCDPLIDASYQGSKDTLTVTFVRNLPAQEEEELVLSPVLPLNGTWRVQLYLQQAEGLECSPVLGSSSVGFDQSPLPDVGETLTGSYEVTAWSTTSAGCPLPFDGTFAITVTAAAQ
jgi:hypothetical protein